MGQRHQFLLKYKDMRDEVKIVTFHSQWSYGRMPIFGLSNLVTAIVNSNQDKKDIEKFGLLNIHYRCYGVVQSLLNINPLYPLCNNLSVYDEDNEYTPMDWCDNNDGYTLIDLTGLKVKYAFVRGYKRKVAITGESYFKKYLKEDCEYYSAMKKMSIKQYKKTDEMKKYVKDFNDANKIIVDNCDLMTNEDVRSFNVPSEVYNKK